MCDFCEITVSIKGVKYGKIAGLKNTAGSTDIKDCQIIIHKDQNPALMIFDRFGGASFIEISNCPMCGRDLTEVAE